MAQHRPLSPKSGVHVDHNANDEEPLIQIQGSQPTTPPTELQGQLASQQENLQNFLSGHDVLPNTSPTSLQTPFIDATHTWAEEQNDVALQHDSVDWTAFNIQDLLPYLLEHPQAGNIAGPPTGTSSTTTPDPSAQSPGPSAAGTHAAAEDIRTVGSPRIRHASASRRKKGGIHQCPFDDCDSTFTELHNLQYHMNSHQDLRPYECTFSECSYAAASPTTLRKHMNKLHQ